MKFKVFFGGKPKYTNKDVKKFSVKGYECKFLMLTKRGKPVAIMENTDPDNHLWLVQYGFSSIFFADYESTMRYCKARFRDLNGKRFNQT